MSNEPESLPETLVSLAVLMAASFEKHQVKYAVIGGLAVGYRTHPRFTRDLDFLLSIPQLTLPALLDELAGVGFSFDAVPTIREWTQHHMVVLKHGETRIDWLKPVIPAYAHVLAQAKDETWLGRPIRVASAEGLILLKLFAFRSQDKVDIENLVAAAEGELDLDWLRAEWQTIAPLDDPRMRWLEEFMTSIE